MNCFSVSAEICISCVHNMPIVHKVCKPCIDLSVRMIPVGFLAKSVFEYRKLSLCSPSC